MQTVQIYHNSVSGMSGVRTNQYWNGSEFTEVPAKVKTTDAQAEVNKVMMYISQNMCILMARIQNNPSELKVKLS